MKKKTILSVAVAAVVVVAGAIPASAGGGGWTSANGCVYGSQGATCYGESWSSSSSRWYAYTTHYQWANLSAQGKFNAYGTWYYSPYVVADDGAFSYSVHYLDLHQHWW